MTSVQRSTDIKVIKVKDDSDYEVVINRGVADGVKEGDRFLIYGIGEELFDPDTHESLGKLEIVRGRGRVVHVQELVATVQSTEKSTEKVSSKRIIKKNPYSMLSIMGGEVIEEIDPSSTKPLPFDDPKMGDFARKL